MAIICRILQCRQNLLRLAKPIIHTHLLTHFFSLFEVFNGLFFLACVRVKLTQIHETSGILWLVSQGLEQFYPLENQFPRLFKFHSAKDMGVRPTQLTDRRRGLNLPLALVMICGTSICNSVTKRSSVISLTIPSPFLT